ncbi:MAG: GNAT family N-acetyltransferase, partial [Candidatus Kariarchaeaceae archaeon]
MDDETYELEWYDHYYNIIQQFSCNKVIPMTETSEDNIIIRPLVLPKDAGKLSNLLDAFNDSWEGGFYGEGQNTAETATELVNQLINIEIFIAEAPNGEFAGYCSLHHHYQDADACYVGLLGAHPNYMGKKVGKRLMLAALDRAKEEKLNRLDLGTWAGNLKAIPLYKKLGLFWVPETAVDMESYIPYILSEPIFSVFWEIHPDWYSILQRKLDQAPDVEKYQNMSVYTYQFVEGSDSLTIWIDRYAKKIMGFEQILDGKILKIDLVSGSNNVHRGLPLTSTVRASFSNT